MSFASIPKISVIVPTLNEARVLYRTLDSLAEIRRRGHEIVLVDGGSMDATIDYARPHVDQIVFAKRGRARQMNAGAEQASGDVLLFLHADTCLPRLADVGVLLELARTGRSWGRFDVSLTGLHPLFRIIERLMSLRSRVTAIATGDQAIFVDRRLFESVGGFPDIPLMEDVALSKVLRRRGRPVCLWHRVQTSSRRWEENGIARTVLRMWYLRAAFALGADPAALDRAYRRR